MVGIDEGSSSITGFPGRKRIGAAWVRVHCRLDQDYTGNLRTVPPSGDAELSLRPTAICVRCGQTANYSQRTFESDERVAVGAG